MLLYYDKELTKQIGSRPSCLSRPASSARTWSIALLIQYVKRMARLVLFDVGFTNTSSQNSGRRIDRFSVKGFRSFKDVCTISFPDLAVIIGSNGAGKSNSIKFFEMLSFMLRSQNLSEFVAKNGGADDQLFMGARRTPKWKLKFVSERSLDLTTTSLP